MAGTELIIDDDFCSATAKYLVQQGEHLDIILSRYLSILEEIRETSIKEGDVADALSAYITYAEKLCKQLCYASQITKAHVQFFLAQIDAADRYLF